VTTPRAFLSQVTRRTVELLISSGGSMDYASAERRAAMEVARSERLKPRATPLRPAHNAKPGSARARLMASLNAIASRMTGSSLPTASVVQTVRRERGISPDVSNTSLAPSSSSSEEPQPDEGLGMLLYSASNTGTGGQLIDDREYPIRYRDPTTANWRRSIEENERRARSRGA
jgi:hypothetical protein